MGGFSQHNFFTSGIKNPKNFFGSGSIPFNHEPKQQLFTQCIRLTYLQQGWMAGRIIYSVKVLLSNFLGRSLPSLLLAVPPLGRRRLASGSLADCGPARCTAASGSPASHC